MSDDAISKITDRFSVSKLGANSESKPEIWLLKVGEKVPTSVDQIGLMRTGSMARAFNDHGFNVTWWTGDFDHFTKKHFHGKNHEVYLSDSYRLRYLHSAGYQKNISLQRFQSHQQEAREFTSWAEKSKPPKLIVASMPTIDLALAASEFASKHSIPFILDIRDLWPEIFIDHIERRLPLPLVRTLARLVFSKQFKNLKLACERTAGFTGVGPKMVDYGIRLSGRKRCDLDGHVWIGSNLNKQVVSESDRADLLQKLGAPTDKKLVLYVGTFSEILEIDCLVKAVQRSVNRLPDVHFVFCGKGDHWQELRDAVSGFNNISMPGWIEREEVQKLMSIGSIGLIPFKSRKDFQWSLPNKTFEYLRCGLPIVSPLKGELESLLKEKAVGLSYENGDSEGLVSALTKLLEDQSVYEAVRQNVDSVASELDSRFIYQRWVESLIESLAERSTERLTKQLEINL